VDIDLESFFDRVQHDVLMARVARRVKDKRILRLIRRYLQAGMMEGGVVSPRRQGTPQGSPLSPLLSNILLDELDKELEARGHSFVRYADDCNVYVRSEKAGQRVLASLEHFLTKRLRQTINQKKSGVGRPWQRGFLGYSVTSGLKPRMRISAKALARLKAKIRATLRQGRGRSLHHTCATLSLALRGWVAYYRLAETPSVFTRLDGWLHHRMRCLAWRHWKRHGTRLEKLLQLGANPLREGVPAWLNRGPWAQANSRAMRAALHPGWWKALGLPSLSHEYRRFHVTT
jgi:RNA-directed DNA polymerase